MHHCSFKVDARKCTNFEVPTNGQHWVHHCAQLALSTVESRAKGAYSSIRFTAVEPPRTACRVRLSGLGEGTHKLKEGSVAADPSRGSKLIEDTVAAGGILEGVNCWQRAA